MNRMLSLAFAAYYTLALGMIVFDFVAWLRHRRAGADFLHGAVEAVALPGFGVPAVLLSRARARRPGRTVYDYAPEISFRGNRSDVLYRSDPAGEMNVVPIEEALLLNSNRTKRGLLIEALKRDFYEGLYSIRKAVRDEDTETSHYAASALMELEATLQRQLQVARARHAADGADVRRTRDYALALQRYLRSGVGDAGTRQTCSRDYLHVLDQLCLRLPEEEEYHVERINLLLDGGDYPRAERACAAFFQQGRRRETPYLLYLKLYYLMGKKHEFALMLARLRASRIKLSANGLSILRLWLSEGDLLE